MQGRTAPVPNSDADRTVDEVTEFVFCAALGRRVPVRFKKGRRGTPRRAEVADCPAMVDGSCDLRCLTPVGGAPFA